MPDLLDVSVWLPLSAPDHVHYPRALRYWNEESAEELVFCPRRPGSVIVL